MSTVLLTAAGLYTDSGITSNSFIINSLPKIRTITVKNNTFIVAGAGCLPTIELMINHLKLQEDFSAETLWPYTYASEHSASLLIYHKESCIAYQLDSAMPQAYIVPFPAAIGTGTPYVLAAYSACLDAVKAMEIAIDMDCYSSGTITQNIFKDLYND